MQYDTALKSLLHAAFENFFFQVAGTPVAQWLNTESPRVQRSTFRKPTCEVSRSEWSKLFKLNPTGVLHIRWECHPAPKESGSGLTVNGGYLASGVNV